ncbi:MAG: UDP-N-acetyl glucosamine 2-epimerase, partial [Undibacterium sp.]
ETMGNVIAKSYKLIQEQKPDAILILGDTNSSLSAISAKRLKTPIFHMEAGNRCWDWNVAEMTNRVIVDHIADVNLPYSHVAFDNLMKEGMPKDRIFITGSPMKEVLLAHHDQIESSDILSKLGLKKDGYIVISAHREENIDIEKNFMSLMNAINTIAETYQLPVIYSTHPRSQK